MADSYLAIDEMANDIHMNGRVRACACQQQLLGNVDLPPNPMTWVTEQRYFWAASPSWGEKWDYAKETHSEDPLYEPGKDAAVITDADILATVQSFGNPSP